MVLSQKYSLVIKVIVDIAVIVVIVDIVFIVVIVVTL